MTRQTAERRGRRAEYWAALWLRLKGYAVLARRVRTPMGEIDLVVRRGRTLAFVEVKARPDHADIAAALSASALRRVRHAANYLLARYAGDCESVRIDAVLIVPGRLPHHIKGVCEGEWR